MQFSSKARTPALTSEHHAGRSLALVSHVEEGMSQRLRDSFRESLYRFFGRPSERCPAVSSVFWGVGCRPFVEHGLPTGAEGAAEWRGCSQTQHARGLQCLLLCPAT